MTVSSVGGSPLLKLLEMLKTLDRDGDGAISRTECVEGRPAGLSSDQPAGLNASDFVSAFQHLDPQMQASLIQAQGESSHLLGAIVTSGSLSGSDRLLSQIAHNLKDAVIAYLKDEKEKEVWTVKTEKVSDDTTEQTLG